VESQNRTAEMVTQTE